MYEKYKPPVMRMALTKCNILRPEAAKRILICLKERSLAASKILLAHVLLKELSHQKSA